MSYGSVDAVPAGRRLVPLRPLGVGEILDAALDAVRRNPGPTLLLGALTATTLEVLAVPVQTIARNLSVAAPAGHGSVDVPAALAELFALGVSAIVIAFLGIALHAVLTGAMAVVISESVLGRRVRIRTVWSRLRPRMWRLLGAAFGVALAVTAAFTVFGVGAVFAWIVLSVVPAVVVLEESSIFGAFGRSWTLVIRDFWRAAGILIFGWIVSELLSIVLSAPFLTVGQVIGHGLFGENQGSVLTLAFAALASIASGLLTAPFTGCLASLLYIDRRMRSEGLDISLGQRARVARDPRRAVAL
jgi:hypothetical protein